MTAPRATSRHDEQYPRFSHWSSRCCARSASEDADPQRRNAAAEIVAHLAELDTRDFHLREGYPSLFVYCRDALGLSDWEAYNRIEVARVARKFPVILEMLAEGSIHLTTVKRLAPHLTPGNCREVLASARGKRKAEVEEIVARLAPRPDAKPFVRRLPAGLSQSGTAMESGGATASRADRDADVALRPDPLLVASDAGPASSTDAPSSEGGATSFDGDARNSAEAATSSPHAATPSSSRPTAAVLMPLSPDRYKLQLTIGGETLEKFRLAKDMLGHSLPSGDDAAVLDRALTALLTELAKKKFADTARPRGSKGRKPGARTPSAAVKRAVWMRDFGRCTFVGKHGHRCNERRFVEFHHVDPYALGGEATVDGIQLRCRRHNDYEGRLYVGKRRRSGELVPEQVRLSPSRSIS